MYMETAKIMSKGQITIPKDIRKKLGIDVGDRVTFVCCDDGKIMIINASDYAMKLLQKEMIGEAEKAGINTEEDIMDLVKEIRKERGYR